MIRWLRTNRFLRQALEDAHASLTACSADLEIEKFATERLEHHLAEAQAARCPMCDELDYTLREVAVHVHKLEADNTRLEWENDKWRAYFAASVPPLDAS